MSKIIATVAITAATIVGLTAPAADARSICNGISCFTGR